MSLVHVNGVDIYYTLEGNADAPVIVLSNSLGTELSMWAQQAQALCADFRVLRYDTRGHGRSAKPAGPYTIEQLGKDVLALTATLGIDKFSFCGISMGGLTGLWLGAHAGDKLEKLIVCNTAAKLGSATAWHERAALVRSEGMAPVVAGTPGRWFTAEYLQQHGAYVNELLEKLARTDPEGYAACCEALAEADLRPQLASITTSTLVIAGELDPVTTVEDADYLTQHIKTASQVNLPCSHISNIECANEFTQEIHHFLSR